MKNKRILLVLLRVSMGWLFLYAGLTKVLDATWTASGYLNSAQTFTGLYQWLAGPTMLPIVNLLNQWGLVVIGVCLILGLFIRWTALFGSLLMLLYYIPALNFPYAGSHSFLVDEHIIYILVLFFLGAFNAGRIFGLDKLLYGRKN